jgi:predicted TPR repeat methyltransferase
MDSACTALKKLKRHGTSASFSSRPWSPDFWKPWLEALKAHPFKFFPTDLEKLVSPQLICCALRNLNGVNMTLTVAANTYADVGAHFDRMAGKYDEGCGKVAWIGPERLYAELAQLIKRHIDGLRVLDLGAGTGRLGALFKEADKRIHVTGVDLASQMLAVALQESRVDEIHVGSATDLPKNFDGQYDVVTSAGVLDFIPDTNAFAAQTARALKPGGLWAVTFEPEGTEFPGVKTIRHAQHTLTRQFRVHGLSVLNAQKIPAAYTNFKTGRPVENVALFGICEI